MEHAMTETWTANVQNPAAPETSMRKRAAAFLFSRAEAVSAVNASGMPPVVQFLLHAMSWCRAKLAANTDANTPLRRVSQLSLGGKKSLTLVEADGVRFLVGGGTDNVTVIVPIVQPAFGTQENAADIYPRSVQTTRDL
jgi:hypothetical protein